MSSRRRPNIDADAILVLRQSPATDPHTPAIPTAFRSLNLASETLPQVAQHHMAFVCAVGGVPAGANEQALTVYGRRGLPPASRAARGGPAVL